MKIKYHSLTDIGRVRKTNQDNIKVTHLKNGNFIVVLCDGMGGHARGEVASKIATTILTKLFSEEDFSKINTKDEINKWMRQAIYNIIANMKIMANADSGLEDMGTTLTAFMVIDEVGYIVNVGDSRTYKFNHDKKQLKQITIDQNLYNLATDEERQLRNNLGDFGNNFNEATYWKILTSAIGPNKKLKIDTYLLKNPIGTFLLTSDGVHDYLDDESIIEVLDSDSKIKNKAYKLINQALENLSTDNLSVAIVEVEA